MQENVPFATNGTTIVHLAQALPFNFTSMQQSTRTAGYLTAMLTPGFSNITNSYSIRTPINITYTTCGESCIVQLLVSIDDKVDGEYIADITQGFGFDVNCTRSESNLDFGREPNVNGSFSAKNTDAFTSDVVLRYDRNASSSQFINSRVELFTSITPDGKILQNNTCDMYAALVRYDVNLADGTARLQSNNYRDDRVINRMYVENTTASDVAKLIIASPQFSPQLVAGFQVAAQNMFQSTATYNFGGAVSSWNFAGSLANRYLAGSFSQTDLSAPTITWSDFMEDMISAVRELGFRAAVQEAINNSTAPGTAQSVAFTGTEVRTLYAIRKVYMIIAALLGVTSGMIVAITLRGWWLLGSTVSMSPLEVANAFDAPLMRHLDDNADVHDILADSRNTNVRYGGSADTSGFAENHAQIGPMRRIFVGMN